MICPFCGKEMEKGILSGDGRSRVRWKAGDKKANLSDTLIDSGRVTAVSYTLASFTVESYFCAACKKITKTIEEEYKFDHSFKCKPEFRRNQPF